jgi:rhamnosyltransferase
MNDPVPDAPPRGAPPRGAHPAEIDVVVRCRNEMPYTRRTLEMLERQRGVRARVLFLDCRSTDGSREVAVEHRVRIVDIEPSSYVPGRVLNLGMRETSSPVVAFVNADAFPVDEDALARLIAPLGRGGGPAATYGRQGARPDASRCVKLEQDRAFPSAGAPALRRGRFFSMAASAIRRDAWTLLPFDEDLRYSEDVDWTRRIDAVGLTTEYVPDARFEHSHDYTLSAQLKRRGGEGEADAAIHRLGPPSPLGDLARPLTGAVLRDLRGGVVSPYAAATRAAQALGYYLGRRRAAARLSTPA